MTYHRILLTGATGFVGRELVPRLHASGWPLTLAVRGSRPDGAWPRESRVVATGAIGPETRWAEALDGVGAVVHLAAHVHVAPERAEHEADVFDAVNHLGSVRLLEDAATAGARLFVFLSSITVLGASSPPGGAFDDATEPAPATPYARSKLAAEIGLRRRAAELGVSLVVLRPPLIAGPGVGGNLQALLRLAASRLPLPFGALGNRRTLLSRTNLCSAIDRVIRDPHPGTFVLGDRAPLSTGGIVEALRAGLGRRPGLVSVPPALMRRAAAFLGFPGHADRLFGDLAVDSRGFRDRYGWHDEVGTEETLRATALASRTSAARGPARSPTL